MARMCLKKPRSSRIPAKTPENMVRKAWSDPIQEMADEEEDGISVVE